MKQAAAACALMTLAAVAAAASCNVVFGIEQYEAGAEDASLDATRDAKAETAPETSNACSPPGLQRCSGSGFETCAKDGTWGTVNDCLNQTCSGGFCMPTPASCGTNGAGVTNCGPAGNQSCCSSPEEVEDGTFDRSYDGLSSGYTSKVYPAAVSSFRLDGYEITVGRFRPFVAAVVGGWKPAQGSGLHTHLNGGNGLAATGGGNETGWESSWSSNLAGTTVGWNGNLGMGTWTDEPGAPTNNENLPITQVSWYEAYAFCIWDGGFLPSEAEWNFAAAGGAEQRAYPWSIPLPPGSTISTCMNANTSSSTSNASCPAKAPNAVGSESPAGDGKWGQSDLAGNVWEWVLDWNAPYVTPCSDCANLTPSSNRVIRGGSFLASPALALASARNSSGPAMRAVDVGARCARIPPP